MKINCLSVHTQDRTGGIQLINLQCSSFSHDGLSLSYEVSWSTGTFQGSSVNCWKTQGQVRGKLPDLGL